MNEEAVENAAEEGEVVIQSVSDVGHVAVENVTKTAGDFFTWVKSFITWDNLFKVVHALDLIGVKSIVSGIRPEIAQTIISLGIDFSKITTCANLHTALASIGLKRVVE